MEKFEAGLDFKIILQALSMSTGHWSTHHLQMEILRKRVRTAGTAKRPMVTPVVLQRYAALLGETFRWTAISSELQKPEN